LTNILVGHPYVSRSTYVGRLQNEEKTIHIDMTNSAMKPRNILLTLKECNERNVTIIEQVYNVMTIYWRSQWGHKTKLQQLMMLVEQDMYLLWNKFNEGTNVLQDLFWKHLFQLNYWIHLILVMDTTYKTNKYRLPLLEIDCWYYLYRVGIFLFHLFWWKHNVRITLCGPW